MDCCCSQGLNFKYIFSAESQLSCNLFVLQSCTQMLTCFMLGLGFSSALLDSGRKAEALKFLRLVVAYNPNYNYLLEEVENEEDNFASDLVNSRRRDY